MPELPEVETIVREMNDINLIGLSIIDVHVFWPRSIAKPTVEQFCKKIKGQKIWQISRRGKLIVITLSDYVLFIHLRMTGKFLIAEKEKEIGSHERLRLYLNDGRILRYEDQRKFGKWYLVSNPDEILNKLGIEPFSKEFTLDALKLLLRRHKRSIKPFLLDQKYITGLGNIYVDEALWEAKIHPLRLTSSLTDNEIQLLFESVRKVLQKGIDNIGTSLGSKRANYFSISGRRGGNQYKLNVFRRNGLLCPRCNSIIEKIVVAQRGTHICPHCQKGTFKTL